MTAHPSRSVPKARVGDRVAVLSPAFAAFYDGVVRYLSTPRLDRLPDGRVSLTISC